MSRRGDYAVRAVFDIASHHGTRRKAAAIASAMAIPRGYLSQILSDLVQAGILRAQAGPAGGYTLAVEPRTLTLRVVVEAIEGLMTLETCVLRGGPCAWEDRCPIHDTWASAQQAFAAALEATTFADLTSGAT